LPAPESAEHQPLKPDDIKKNGAGTLGEIARTIKFGVVSSYGKSFEGTREYRRSGISSGMGW
jgi:hypothetical protein